MQCIRHVHESSVQSIILNKNRTQFELQKQF